jgi:fructokinase
VIVVIGEILIDIFQDYQRIGGAPFNFAFHLKQLGFSVRFLTRVGNDRHGRRIIDMLEEKGFDTADRSGRFTASHGNGLRGSE